MNSFHSQPADEKCILLSVFVVVVVVCYRSICTPVNNDYVHLMWNRAVVRRTIDGRRGDVLQRNSQSQQCQTLWESETNVPFHRDLDCHFPFRILIFKRKRARSWNQNAMCIRKKNPSRCFSFYHFIVRKIQYSRCWFVSRGNKCWLTESYKALVLGQKKEEKHHAKWKFFCSRLM